MYVLHWEYMAGSIVVQALLQDADVAFEARYVDMGSGEHKKPYYQSINPTGRVPALTLPNAKTIGETGAIFTYLCETYPDAGLSPRPGDADRPEFLFWLNVMTSTGYPTVVRWNHPERYVRSDAAIAEVEQQGLVDLNSFFDLMENGISGQNSFLESGLSALDYYLSMLTEWYPDREMLFSKNPKIAAVYTSASNCPAYKQSMNRHALPKAAA